MQWKTIKSNIGHTAFGLWNNGHKMLTLAYKGKSDALYLESEDGDKRLFHYRKRGIFKKKLVLENEYGVGLGNLTKEGETEFIEIDDKRYFLHYKNNHKEVEVIDEEAKKAIATFDFDDNPNDASNYSLLMVSCLYLKRKKTFSSLSV